MTLDRAVRADKAGQIVEAAIQYEEVLRGDNPPLDALLNLAVLYWQVTDYGFWTGKGLSSDFVANAGRRFPQILTRAAELCPGSTDVRFWTMYIDWLDLGGEFSAPDCVRLLSEDPDVLTPIVFLVGSGIGIYRSEALQLLRQAQESGTTKDRYVESVIEAALAFRE